MSQKKVLVVEDESDLVSMITMNLKREGYRVFASKTAEDALDSQRKNRPDIVLLDIMLPKMDGFELCKTMRKHSQVPVIFLTAKQMENDKLEGLRAGGDDYVVKPFSIMELVARVRSVLRRAEQKEVKGPDAPVTIGGVHIDWERHEVSVKGKMSCLTPTEFDLLRLLVDAHGKVLTRDALIARVWGAESPDGLHTRTVDQHIASLRRKLGNERERIETVPNLGYKLVTE